MAAKIHKSVELTALTFAIPMKIRLICFGALDQKYLKEGVELYIQKLKHYTRLEIEEILLPRSKQSEDPRKIKEAEGQLLLNKLKSGDQLYLFDEKGKEFDSVGLSNFIEDKQNYLRGDLILVIGGAFGYDDAVYTRADGKISCSRMTFNHQMFRLIALEQLYRAFTIIKGEPYHHVWSYSKFAV